MYRQSLRTASSSLNRAVTRQQGSRRLITTAPPHETSRSWKNSALRFGLAGAVVYYYNTSSAFAEEPPYAVHAPPETQRETETYPTIEAVAEQRRTQSQSQSRVALAPAPNAEGADAPVPDSAEGLEEEAQQQGAFNEETGEINWDCPCLGGMADGPCGEQFKAAFSCFVYSKEEPKGVDCIDNFKNMQNCFREHPEVYGAELDDEDREDAPEVNVEGQKEGGHAAEGHSGDPQADAGGRSEPQAAAAPSLAKVGDYHDGQAEKVAVIRDVKPASPEVIAGRTERAEAATEQVQRDHGEREAKSESKSAVPKAAHDAR